MTAKLVEGTDLKIEKIKLFHGSPLGFILCWCLSVVAISALKYFSSQDVIYLLINHKMERTPINFQKS